MRFRKYPAQELDPAVSFRGAEVIKTDAAIVQDLITELFIAAGSSEE